MGLVTLTSILSRDGTVSFPLTLALSLVGEREIKELGFHRKIKEGVVFRV